MCVCYVWIVGGCGLTLVFRCGSYWDGDSTSSLRVGVVIVL